MALPSNSGSKADLPAQAWDAIRNIAGQVKVNSVNLRNASAAGDIAADRVVRYVAMLADAISNLPRLTQVPGLLPYVREQLDDPAFDIVAEYNAMLAQIVADALEQAAAGDQQMLAMQQQQAAIAAQPIIDQMLAMGAAPAAPPMDPMLAFGETPGGIPMPEADPMMGL
jgi:hypothetical protein